MAVTFTPNIGLAKVTEAELAANWVNGSQLNSDNNAIIQSKMAIALTAYTPTIIASVTPPNLGASAVFTAEYIEVQGYIFGTFTGLVLGSGIAAGSGNYGIKLPVVADPVYHSVGTALTDSPGIPSCIGEGYVYDDSSIAGSTTCALDVVTVAGVSYARLITETFTGKAALMYGSASPAAIAVNDAFSGSFNYKKL